jgi:hypothetical protein
MDQNTIKLAVRAAPQANLIFVVIIMISTVI